MAQVAGLTGGIATGKSTVARMFRELGAHIIDADAIVHELQAPGEPLLAEIVRCFGQEILRADGSLHRARLGERVFRDAGARQRLNRIVHPRVAIEIRDRLARAVRSDAPLVLLDVPLLLEGRTLLAAEFASARAAGQTGHPVVLVYAPESLQLERQVVRDGVRPEYALERIHAQLPIEEKRARADHVIDNSGSLERTERQVRALFRLLSAKA